MRAAGAALHVVLISGGEGCLVVASQLVRKSCNYSFESTRLARNIHIWTNEMLVEGVAVQLTN